jgi:uncharacterized protein YjbI with pentapeptide repeats
MNRKRLLSCAILVAAWQVAGAAEHMSATDVRAAVASASAAAARVDLSGRDMHGDDLSRIDLTGANLQHADLSGCNLYGVKLVDADLRGANLARADLNFTWIIRANFAGANLGGASLQTIVTSTGFANVPGEAADFSGVDFTGARMTVHFSWDRMAHAKFAHADMSADMRNQSMGLLRTEFDQSELTGADFGDAGAAHLTFRYAKLDGASFARADVRDSDFSGASLVGADFTGAKTDGANFDGADLQGVKGLETGGRGK